MALPSPAGTSNYDFLLRRPSALLEAQYEDAILSIGSAMTAVELRDAVSSALHLALLNVRHSLVLLLDLETNELGYFQADNTVRTMPKSGVVWDVVRRRTPDISRQNIPPDDPIRELLPAMGILDKNQVVVLSPLVEKRGQRVVALLMAVCEEPAEMHKERLYMLERNVLVAASRVLKHVAAEKERSRAEDMLRVCGELIDLDIASLSVKILKHLKSILDAEMCLLFLIDDGTNELVLQVFDDLPLDKEIRIPITESLYGRCLTGETVNIGDVSKDMRFNPEIDLVKDFEPSSLLCMPVKVPQPSEGKVIAVAAACHKEKNVVFTSRDVDNMSFVLRFSSNVLANTLAYERERVLKKQNEALLQVARKLFTSLDDLDVLLSEIMHEAQNITHSEKCSLFLLDDQRTELVATVFDSDLPVKDNQEPLRIPVGQGIAGYVAKTGKSVNIRDAYKHPKFFRDVDKATGFHTRNILCFPITINTGEVVGVAQLCNKVGAKFFTKYDEELAMTFAVYCGISIYHSQLYSDMLQSRSRSKVATELMIYHMNIPDEEVERLSRAEVPSALHYSQQISRFTYSPRNIQESDTIMAVLSMVNEMGLIKRWRLQKNTLARFVLMVKRGYRNPSYHNWSHAFAVAHFSYLLFQNCERLGLLSDIEILALFFSCLCHDIDHRGTNNAFQVSSNSVLASLYHTEGSVMERHHFAQTLSILHSEKCDIFRCLSPQDYKRVLDLMQHNILATDIANHLRHMKEIEHMGEVGFDSSNPAHHELLCSLLMTSCDLSANCKDWESTKSICDLIYTEFFSQGDLEKAMDKAPSEMMDRERAFIPELQLGFLDGIAGPVYKVLAKVLPQTGVVYESLKQNRMKWVELKKEGRKPSDTDTDLV